MKVFISGATGNVGRALLNKLAQSDVELYAGVRDAQRNKSMPGHCHEYLIFDLDKGIYPAIDFDAVFLIRPPRIANPEIFKNYLSTLNTTTKVVFLSVFGAEKHHYLPHAKIEKVICGLGLHHVFIRPCYFMENLTTTLWKELEKNKRIYLPTGDMKFQWVAIGDIAEVAKRALLQDLGEDAINVCSHEVYGFREVVDRINSICSTGLRYESPALVKYMMYNIKNGEKLAFTLVMLLLHYLPRFKKQQTTPSSDIKRVTGKDPTSLNDFISSNCKKFESLAET